MLPRNIGPVDRTFRVVLGVALLAFFFAVPESPGTGSAWWGSSRC